MSGGRRPGTKKTGGRTKGTPNKATLARQAALRSVEEEFKDRKYNPLVEMIKLAQKERLGKYDPIRFSFHRELAMKYYPHVAAIKVDAQVSVQERFDTPEKRQARIAELEAEIRRFRPVEPIQLLEGGAE